MAGCSTASADRRGRAVTRTYSGGMQRRLDVAGLVTGPVLFLDKLTAASTEIAGGM
jgi:ABC-type phosphonate transport system ATPase subunit